MSSFARNFICVTFIIDRNVSEKIVEKLLRTKFGSVSVSLFWIRKIKVCRYEPLDFFVKVFLKGRIRYFLTQKLLVRKSFHKWKGVVPFIELIYFRRETQQRFIRMTNREFFMLINRYCWTLINEHEPNFVKIFASF